MIHLCALRCECTNILTILLSFEHSAIPPFMCDVLHSWVDFLSNWPMNDPLRLFPVDRVYPRGLYSFSTSTLTPHPCPAPVFLLLVVVVP